MRIVVNGGTRGIGIEIVRSLATNRNHMVVATGRYTDKLEELSGSFSNIISFKLDISNFAEHSEAYRMFIEQNLGEVDILVNVSGMLVNKEFMKISDLESRMLMEVNFFGPALAIRALKPIMHDGSHIVNISSMGGYLGSSKYKGLSYYSSSKAAIACLTECLAEEFRDSGIKVNCLALGSVDTEMLKKAFPGYKAPVAAEAMGEFIASFALTGQKVFNGKVLPVAVTNP